MLSTSWSGYPLPYVHVCCTTDDDNDIIDEALYYFKANVFFKSYEVKVILLRLYVCDTCCSDILLYATEKALEKDITHIKIQVLLLPEERVHFVHVSKYVFLSWTYMIVQGLA